MTVTSCFSSAQVAMRELANQNRWKILQTFNSRRTLTSIYRYRWYPQNTRSYNLHNNYHSRNQWSNLSGRSNYGKLWWKPDIHDHPGHRVSRCWCTGKRSIGGNSNKLPVPKRDGRSDNLRATFAIDTFTITTTDRNQWSNLSGRRNTVNYGGSQTYTITPDIGYHVVDVLVNGASVGPVTSYQFLRVTEDQTISATFAIDTFTITTTAGTNGAISPGGVTTVNYGGSQTYTITPGYRVSRCWCTGKRSISGTSNKLPVPKRDWRSDNLMKHLQ